MESLLSARELAKLLWVSREWVLAQARDHALPGYKIGREWRFDAGEVAAWLARQGNAPTRAPDSARRVLPNRPDVEAVPAPVNLATAVEAQQAAEVLGVPLATVRQWVSGGLLPGLVSRGVCLIDRDAWEQWLKLLHHPEGHAFTFPPGRTRTTLIRESIESALLHRRDGWLARSPRSTRHHGGTIPRWSEVFPSGRQ